MAIFHDILTVFLIMYLYQAVNSEPCLSYTILPRSDYRGGQCDYIQDKDVCDSFLSSNTWYRVNSRNGDLMIKNNPAEFMKCGTKYPWWMNGTHPEVTDGEVERNMCLTDMSSNCTLSKTIMVKNCGTFYVYNLSRTSSCPQAYCFGENDPCPPTDPCDVYEHSSIEYHASRSLYCKNTGVSLCDDFDSNTWYAFKGPSGYLNIATRCPATMSTCGTQSPHWLTGITIETINGTQIGVVCIKDGDHCCSNSTSIEIKNCSEGFKVYRLGQKWNDQCHTYCTDDEQVNCPDTTTNTGSVSLASTVSYMANDFSRDDERGLVTDDGTQSVWMICGLCIGVVAGVIIGGLCVYGGIRLRMRRVSALYTQEKCCCQSEGQTHTNALAIISKPYTMTGQNLK